MRFHLAVAVLLAALVLMKGVAQAEPLTPMHARTLIVIAHGETGLALPETMPIIEIVSADRMQTLACGERRCWPPKALTVESRVFVLDAMDWANPETSIVLVHEFVHVLQWHAHGAVSDCAEWLRRERQAWDVTVKLLRTSGRSTMQAEMARAGMHCS
jgi:hypothetical protein